MERASDAVVALAAEVGIWPVYMVLPHVRGYALWGGNFDGDADKFLLSHGKVALYSSVTRMSMGLDVTLTEGFEDHPGFSRLAAGLSEAVMVGTAINAVPTFDFVEARASLSSCAGRVPDRGVVVACLDCGYDLARQIGGPIGQSSIDRSSMLSALYDYLWQEEDGEWSDLYLAAFDQLIDWVTSSVVEIV